MNTIIFAKVSTLNLTSKYSFFSKISKMLYLIAFQGFFRQQNCEHYKEIHGNHYKSKNPVSMFKTCCRRKN